MRHRMLGIGIAAAAALIAGSPSTAAEPLSPSAQRGLVFVRTNCAQCHAIGREGASPLSIAPPFRTLHQKYPVESLAESFAEGIVTGHPSMPEFRLEPDRINAVISYLKTLER
jgi:cytochrome c